MKRVTGVCAVASSVAAVLTWSAVQTYANGPDDPSVIAGEVSRAVPAGLAAEDTAAVPTAGAFEAARGDTRVILPLDSAGMVQATKTGQSGEAITVRIGTGAASAAQGRLARDGSVVYAGKGVSHTVRPTEDGVRMHTVITGSQDPTSFVHRVTLPAGTSLVPENEMPAVDGQVPGGSRVFLVSRNGSVVGGFSAPWAKDAAGRNVPTRYEVRSGALVQVVDHKARGITYPVVADPYLGFDMIKSAKWVNHAEGRTLEVAPTGWSRSLAGSYLAGVYGWKELLAKQEKYGLQHNLGGMRDQYICHQQVVAVRAPRKSTWNLDEWRRDVSYAETIQTSCNPGGPKWFD